MEKKRVPKSVHRKYSVQALLKTTRRAWLTKISANERKQNVGKTMQMWEAIYKATEKTRNEKILLLLRKQDRKWTWCLLKLWLW